MIKTGKSTNHTSEEVPMSSVRRVYVEKKAPFAVKAKELKHEISSYLGIDTVTSVRELIRYDVENISDVTDICESVYVRVCGASGGCAL